MSRRGRILELVALLVLGALLAPAGAQQEAKVTLPETELPLDARVAAMAERLGTARVFATLAVFSPTLSDQHLHAQRVVNLLEGSGGDHFVERFSGEGKVSGLLPEARAIAGLLARLPEDRRPPEEATLAARSVVSFLDLALDDALAAVRSRRVEGAAEAMRRAYAFLTAALGAAGDPPALGGIRTLAGLLASFPPRP